MSYLPPPRQTGESYESLDEPGFFRALIDIRFDLAVAPTILGAMYVVALVAIGGSGALVFSFAVYLLATGDLVGGLAFIVSGPLLAFFAILLVRVSMELLMAVFNIADDLRTMCSIAESGR